MSQSLLKILADFTVQLASPVAVGDTTATLTSATDDDGVALPTGLYGLTIDSGQSNKEYIVCTLTGTALTAISTISRQGATTSGFARAHRRGAKVTITDWAILSRMLKNLNGDTGLNASAPLYYDGTATINSANQLATKAYADGLAIAGAGNADTTTQGLVQIATQAEVDAGEDFGTSGAYVVAVPATSRARKYHDYAADSVGTDAYAITITPAITAYAAGQEFTFKAGTANTGACTLNVSGLGAKDIKKNYNEDLATGDIVANQIVKVVYDGTNMQMVSKSSFITPVIRTYLNAASPATWTKPAGLKYVIVEVQAGGGGGGSADTNRNAGSGGAGGGYSRKLIPVASLGTTETVTIGAGGAADTAGGTSSFGSHASATGGGGGAESGGISTPGVGSGGDINLYGGAGHRPMSESTSSTSYEHQGIGGGSFFGNVTPQAADGSGDIAGTAGYIYGSGGGGASSSGGSNAGGAGAAGIVIVTEYYS